ncbi:MAG: zinc ribbon domain-containing protein, partial [Eubacteriales bacterium]
MYCTQCGFENTGDARFCKKCGMHLEDGEDHSEIQEISSPPLPPQQPQAPLPSQQPQVTPTPPAAKPKKKKKALKVVLITLGAIVGLFVLVLVLFWPTPVGQWVNNDHGVLLAFKDDGTMQKYSVAGTDKAKYVYNSPTAAGNVTIGASNYNFSINGDSLTLQSADKKDSIVLTKEKTAVEPKDFVMNSFQGLWSNQQIGEVLQLKGGKIQGYSGYGNFEGIYTFDIDKAKGSIQLSGQEYPFSFENGSLIIEGSGSYQMANANLDIQAFVTQYSNPVIGKWYDKSGTYGTIELNEKGTFQQVSFAGTITGTFTFADGKGELTSDKGKKMSFTISKGTLTYSNVEFTRGEVKQLTL